MNDCIVASCSLDFPLDFLLDFALPVFTDIPKRPFEPALNGNSGVTILILEILNLQLFYRIRLIVAWLRSFPYSIYCWNFCHINNWI